MNAKSITAIVSLIFVSILAFGAAREVQGQDSKAAYPSMAPLDQYLMDRDAEIALARTAAPEAISRDAKIVVLGRHGYETGVAGKSGFVCAVERAWMSSFDEPQFWNPKNRSPICYNPPAARSVLPLAYLRTSLVLAGVPKEKMAERIKAAYDRKDLPALEPGAMSYMMSKAAYLTDDDGHNLAHVMFYTPPMDGANWGADLPHSPVMLLFHGPPEQFNIFIVAVGKWSDGTAAPLPH